MLRDGWNQIVLKAAEDPGVRELLVDLLTEQDAAKARLTERFGCIGRPWADLVGDILDEHRRDEP